MSYLGDRYVSVSEYKGFEICTLKVAVPANGDELGYVIDDEKFNNQVFNDIATAMSAIDETN